MVKASPKPKGLTFGEKGGGSWRSETIVEGLTMGSFLFDPFKGRDRKSIVDINEGSAFLLHNQGKRRNKR